jgi:hypothetical protein
LPPSLTWNRIESLAPVGLVGVLQVLLAADFLWALKAAAATCAATVSLLLLVLPFRLLSAHICYPTIGLHPVCLSSAELLLMAGEEYHLPTLPEPIFRPSGCNNLNGCPLLLSVSLLSTIALRLTQCILQVVNRVSLHLCDRRFLTVPHQRLLYHQVYNCKVILLMTTWIWNLNLIRMR